MLGREDSHLYIVVSDCSYLEGGRWPSLVVVVGLLAHRVANAINTLDELFDTVHRMAE
jgi:hypothetical protein